MTPGDVDPVDRIVALEKIKAAVEAEQARLIREYSRSRGFEILELCTELGLALSISESAAQGRIDLAEALLTRLPGTWAAMRRGEIDAYKASKVFEPTETLSDELAQAVDAAVADRLAGRDPSSIRRLVNRTIQRLDPDGAANRAEERRKDRRVEIFHEPDAMSTLIATLPAEVASACYSRIDTQARALRSAGDERNLEQLRADVLAGLILGGNEQSSSAKAEVFVHVDLTTLMGLSNEPGDIPGYGSVPAPIARAIAFDNQSTWRRIITDPHTGQPIDVGRKRYRPPQVTADHARIRDRECVFPNCHRPAMTSDLDHIQAWQHDGATHKQNLQALCRRHHRLKHTPGWRFDHTGGALRITTPTGRSYCQRPGRGPRWWPTESPHPWFDVQVVLSRVSPFARACFIR